MTGEEIRRKITLLNEERKESFTTENAKIFILDDSVVEYFEELEHLQAICPHEFHEGECVFCQIKEEYQ